MTAFTETFKTGKVKRSTGFEPAKCPPPAECPCPPEPPEPCKSYWPAGLNKFVTSLGVDCHPETGKPWLVAECMIFDPSCGQWSTSCEGIYELPVVFKAPVDDEVVTLPDFNGVIDAFDTDGNPIKLTGGQDVPANLAGVVFCINGEVCYLAAPPPAQIIPDEVQLDGAAPADDSGVKLWVSDGLLKYAGPSGWTQTKPYGEKA